MYVGVGGVVYQMIDIYSPTGTNGTITVRSAKQTCAGVPKVSRTCSGPPTR